LALALVAVAIGATWATVELAASPTPTPVSPGQPLSCLNLIGGTATHARDVLQARGEAISWRLVTYKPPDGATWTTTRIDAPSTPVIVEHVLGTSPGGVIVFVQGADDPYAKPPVRPPCSP
jgi:hypothetical protein